MFVLTIRSIDDDLKRKLRIAAAERGISMEGTRGAMVTSKAETRIVLHFINAALQQVSPVIADGQIAAICHHHGATLASRKIRDFVDCGINVVNPWNSLLAPI